MQTRSKKLLSLLLILMMCASMISVPAMAADTPADHVVISQVYGGGGNSGATYKNDFIELYNPTASEVSLDGWSVQYASSSGTTWNGRTNLSGTIGAGKYYLIQEAAGTGGTDLLPTPDASGSIALSATAGKVALVKSTVALTGPMTGGVGDNVVDFVGFGGATAYEGTGPTPAVSNTTAAIRNSSGVDTNDNSADFSAGAPNPRNSSYGAPVETKCATPTSNPASGAVESGTLVTFISTTTGAAIQLNMTAADAADTEWTVGNTVTITGAATYYVRAVKDGLENSDVATFEYTVLPAAPVSIAAAKAADVGTAGIKVEGVVTYISGKNVYIQDETGAICLFLNASATSLKKGDEVIATGTRANYSNLIELSGINEADITVVSSGNAVPDRGTATVAELIATPAGKTAGFDHMCEIIKVKGATLTDASTLTQDGSSIVIYPAVTLTAYPGVALGDSVDVTVRMYDYKGKLEVEVIDMAKSEPPVTLDVTANPGAGSVISGTAVTLTCSDASAAIHYTTDGSDPTASSEVYASPITISGIAGDTVTIKALAVNGENRSGIVTFTYTISDAMTIKDVLALASGTKNVSVIGQIVYFATSYANPVIQDVISGNTYSLYVFGAAPDGAKVGDTVKFTGTYSLYNGLPELSSITSSNITGSAAPMAAEIHTINELKTSGANMLGRFVKIKDVTLGTYNGSGSTPITDATGSINIYKGTPYPVLVAAGDVVDLYAMVACYNSTIQLYTGTAADNGFNVYDVVNDTKAPVITLPDNFLSAKIGKDYTIAVGAQDNKGIQSVAITYTIGATTKTAQAMTFNSESSKYEYTIPGSEITGMAGSIVFTVTAADVAGLKTTSGETTIIIDSNPRITAVTPARNSATGDVKNPVISVTLDNGGTNPTVTMTLKKGVADVVTDQVMTLSGDKVYSYTPDTLTDGKYTVTVTIVRSDAQSITESWNFTVGTVQYTAYFGQLHSHTAQYSDGSGTLQDGLNYLANIPESDNVDFVSFTDHSNYFDTTSSANPPAALNDKSKMTTASLALWNNYVTAMTDFNTAHDGSLVALPGFEMTWSGGPGHINTFNSVGLVSRNNSALNNKSGDAGMKLYYDTLIQNPDPLANLSQFNHPGTTFGTFSDFAYWNPAYDSKMVAVEVGNGEGAIGSGGYFPSYTEYTKALDKGWHVAPTNNQDNHKGHWGNSNTARTVIITDDLSTGGLMEGMKNMSVYASEDKNLNIRYTVNDQMMGSIIAEVPSAPLKFTVNIDDPDSDDVISKVEIVSNGGRVVSSKTFTSNAADWEFELPAAQGYYYVRVTEADMNIAVTAPVWVGSTALVGISSVESGTKMPVTGEAVTLTTTLFNNEASTVVLKSITYSQDGAVLKTETPNIEIAPTGTLKQTFAYTPTVKGTNTITVSAVISLNGEDHEYTSSIALDVRDSALLVYVGIDASHYNEYVDGNYKDNMTNFTNMAEDYNVRVVELKTSDELIAATDNPKYKMLVLTPPTRRNGSAFLIGYKNYSDAEISAVASFATSGGTVIVTGWGDYYEGYKKYTDGTSYTLPADDHMAIQQNKLLAAIGASLRISDDEAKDDTKNGGQAQRLYLTNYNMENPFMNGVDPAVQVFSNYGGSTIYAVDGGNNPATTLPATVSPMVSAFDTSYSSDDDRDGFAGVTIPKYDGRYLIGASETVNHGNGRTSTVIVTGGVFLSNFEIQATLDNYGTPEYSNYTILQNVVRSVNPTVITNIAEVQAAAEGETFTIRGIATSNASGYDKDTAFFDCIYVQDATGGINAFPVSGSIQAGQTVEITGTTSSYNGERQIAVNKITVIDSSIKSLPAAIEETTAQAAGGSNLGSLVAVTGKVTSITAPNNVVESIYVRDASGTECRVFIDGYITSSKTIANLAVGSLLTATGLSSADTSGPRIRIRDRADVVCTAVPVTGVTLDNDSITLNVGESRQLSATVIPDDAANKDLVWTSSNEAAAVVDNGLVTAVGTGNADITVTTVDGNFNAVCKVTAVVPVTGVKLTEESVTVKLGASATLTAVVFPEDATEKGLTWESSDPSVVSVVDGRISGLKVGSAIVKVTTADGGFSDECNVLVAKIPVSGVRIVNDRETLRVGKTMRLIAKVFPSNADVKNALWTSSDPSVATVKDGLVKGLKVGAVDITVKTKDGGYTDTCRIYVGASVTSVKILPSGTQVAVGKEKKLSAIISPGNATNKNVTWSSSDESVALVSQNGVVTGLKQGKVEITVVTEDGGFTAKCTVTVGVEITCVKIIKERLAMTAGESETLKAYVFPRNASAELVWTSSNTAVATVVNGVVKAVGKGEAVITAATKDGTLKDVCTVTVSSPVNDHGGGHGYGHDHGGWH